MSFSDYLRSLRKNKEISLRELSRRSGVSQPYLSQLENGKNDNPSPNVLRQISNVLDVNYVYLLIKAGYLKNDDISDYIKQKL